MNSNDRTIESTSSSSFGLRVLEGGKSSRSKADVISKSVGNGGRKSYIVFRPRPNRKRSTQESTASDQKASHNTEISEMTDSEIEAKLARQQAQMESRFNQFLLDAEKNRAQQAQEFSDFREDMRAIRSEVNVSLSDVRTDIERSKSNMHAWFIGTGLTMTAIVIGAIGLYLRFSATG